MSDFTERAREMLAPYSMPDGVRAALYLQLCALLAREAAMREALSRLHAWGGLFGAWSATITEPVKEWLQGGCVGDLPPVPEHFEKSNGLLRDSRATLGAAPAPSVPSPPGEAPASPTDAELETRTGEPHIDGWPLMSGLPRPRR